VLVVEDRVRDARLREERRKVRLPDAFRQPCSERPLSEDRVYTIGKRPNLGDAIAPRHTDEDRLVVTAGKKLDLTPPDEVRQIADDVRAVGFQPVEEGPREVETRFYLGVPIKGGHERGVRPLGHILED